MVVLHHFYRLINKNYGFYSKLSTVIDKSTFILNVQSKLKNRHHNSNNKNI